MTAPGRHVTGVVPERIRVIDDSWKDSVYYTRFMDSEDKSHF